MPSIKLKILPAVIFWLLLFVSPAISQTKAETVKIIFDITHAVKNDGAFNADCSSFSYKYDLNDCGFNKLTIIGKAEDLYSAIPWKDFELVNVDENVSFSHMDWISIFFSVPVSYRQNKDYTVAPYTELDTSFTRKVRCISMNIQKHKFEVFAKACQRMKILASAGQNSLLESRSILPTIKELPAISYYFKNPPPTKDFVWDVFFNTADYEKSKCENRSITFRFEERFMEATGLTVKKETPGKELLIHYPKVKEYWDYYCYSFCYDGATNGFGSRFRSSFLEEGFYSMNGEVYMFIGYRCKGDLNFLNPFSGRSYLDNFYTRYSHKANTHYCPYGEVDRQGDIDDCEREIATARSYGAKHSSEMIIAYNYEAELHNKLIAAIICNSKGEGIFSGLSDAPVKYLDLLYTIGLRNLDEGVLLFETNYNKKISSQIIAEQRASHSWN